MEIEPTSEAWEACNLTQKTLDWRHFYDFKNAFNWKIMEEWKTATRGGHKLLRSARRPALSKNVFRFSGFVQPRVTYIQISRFSSI